MSSEMNPGPYSNQYLDEYSPRNSPYSASSGSSGSSASPAPAVGGASGANEDVASFSYERARKELAAVVQRLEAGSVPLEDSLTLWERDEALAQRCQTWLDETCARLAAVTQEDLESWRDLGPTGHDLPGPAAPGRMCPHARQIDRHGNVAISPAWYTPACAVN